MVAGGFAWDDCPVGHVVHNICFMICGKDSWRAPWKWLIVGLFRGDSYLREGFTKQLFLLRLRLIFRADIS